jgi:predicted amidohydrolase YtcJ
MSRLLLQNVHIHSLTGESVVGDAEVSNGTIGMVQANGGEGSEYHVYPGFVDSHAHVYGMGERITKPRLEKTTSKEEIFAILRAIPGEGWIVSRGWDQNKWDDKRFPRKEELETISHVRPIALTRIDGHAIWCNSKALELAGITKETEAPLGGEIKFGDDGEPTGILLDEAMQLVERLIPSDDEPSMKGTLRAGLDYFVKKGHVGVHDMGVGAEMWLAYKSLYAEEGDALPRAFVFLDMTKSSGKALFLEQIERDTFDDSPHPHLKLVGIKLYLDGALGSRGAHLFQDYSDDPGNRGLALMRDNDVIHLMQLAASKRLQIAVHAIGDAANARALDLFERAGVADSGATLRMEHAQIIRDEDLPRFAKLGVYALVQPAFYASDRVWAAERLGDRMQIAYRWRSLLRAEVKFVASSDAPIEEPNALDGISLLVHGGGRQGEALDFSQAINAYCKTPHELTKESGIAGTIAVGMRGDLTVVRPGISSETGLSNVEIVATIVDGNVLHANGDLPFLTRD